VSSSQSVAPAKNANRPRKRKRGTRSNFFSVPPLRTRRLHGGLQIRSLRDGLGSRLSSKLSHTRTPSIPSTAFIV
jgi:hypothetical protein